MGEDLQLLQQHQNVFGLYGSGISGVNNATVFSDPHSELTCNASGGGKRPREETQPSLAPPPVSPSLYYPILAAAPVRSPAAMSASGCTSTSGRPASPLTQDLVSLLSLQNNEMDAFLRLQSEKMRRALHEARKRHYKVLLLAEEQRAAKRFKEKELELEKAHRRNAELEERVRQATAENQMWFALAKNNEAMAASLRASLEQVIVQNAAVAQANEGYGDTEDDAQSSSCERRNLALPPPARPTGACRACRREEASVLLLPCRHLCLCKDCESKVTTCPVCDSNKSAYLRIFMS